MRCAAAALIGASAGYVAAQGDNGARIELAASKFEFSAKEVRLKKGQRATFVLATSDFVHGFSVPDLGVRSDFVPGRRIEVTVTPERAGRFVFLCDNFCGEGHDRMSGLIVVTE